MALPSGVFYAFYTLAMPHDWQGNEMGVEAVWGLLEGRCGRA